MYIVTCLCQSNGKFISGSTLLKQQISQLKKYRENGLKTFRSAAIYDRLSERRSENERKLHMLNDILQYIQVGTLRRFQEHLDG